MPTDRLTDTSIGIYLQDEFRAMNANIPRRRKTLSELLDEEHPHVDCSDGSTHAFKRNELDLLSNMLDNEELGLLMLPMLMEVSPGQSGIKIRSPKSIEAKILSAILDMEVMYKQKTVTIFRPQLTVIRRMLKTCTQYVFTA